MLQMSEMQVMSDGSPLVFGLCFFLPIYDDELHISSRSLVPLPLNFIDHLVELGLRVDVAKSASVESRRLHCPENFDPVVHSLLAVPASPATERDRPTLNADIFESGELKPFLEMIGAVEEETLRLEHCTDEFTMPLGGRTSSPEAYFPELDPASGSDNAVHLACGLEPMLDLEACHEEALVD